MDVICKDEQTFVRKHYIPILGLWLHSPAPSVRDPDVNGSRFSVTLTYSKVHSKLQFETEPVSPITEAFSRNDLFPPPFPHIRTCN
jgi:hypothetical protein